MSHITYYNSQKTYIPLEISTPEINIDLELSRFEKKLGFTIDSDDAKAISNPMLLICGRKALVRTNRYTFFNIKIADDMWPLLRHCDNVEMLVNNDDLSFETVYVMVQRVLHFPETLKLDMWKHEAELSAALEDIDILDDDDDVNEDDEDDEDDEGDDSVDDFDFDDFDFEDFDFDDDDDD